MTDATHPDDLAEKEARIRQMTADILLKELDSIKRWQDIRYAPLLLGAGLLTAGAAIGATLLAVAQVLVRLVH